MNWHAIGAIVRKDVTTVLRNRGVRVPLLVAPVIILVVLPVLLVGGATFMATHSALPDAGGALDRVTSQAQMQTAGAGLTGPQGWTLFILASFLAPLYLLVPLMVATVIAADSFAGERERRTLEALLHTPTSDDELLLAKLLASWLPAVAVGTGGFAVYSVVANIVGWPMFGHVFFPTTPWLLLAWWVGPAVAGLGLGIIVLVSSRVSSLQAAHQIGSLVVLPIVLLVIAQVTGFLALTVRNLAVAGALLWAADLTMLVIGARSFRRTALAVRL